MTTRAQPDTIALLTAEWHALFAKINAQGPSSRDSRRLAELDNQLDRAWQERREIISRETAVRFRDKREHFQEPGWSSRVRIREVA